MRERLEQGRAIPESRYRAALEQRRVLFDAVESALGECDALVLPSLPIVAPRLGAAIVTMDNGEELPTRSAMLRLTQLFNITGHPAISLPLPTDGLPVGLQLVGRRDRTGELLQVAAACERRLRV